MRVVLDSNILVIALDPQDVFYGECYPILEKILNLQLEVLCPVLVLVEVTCVLRRRTNSEEIAVDIYRSLSQLPAINWMDINLDVALNACRLGIRTGLKGADAIVLQVAEQHGIPLLTKDKRMKQKAPPGILVYEPSEMPVVS